MFVENVIAGIAGEVCAEAGETDVLICGGNEFRYLDAGEVRFAEAVVDEKEVLLGAVDKALDLVGADLLLRRKDRILFVAFR